MLKRTRIDDDLDEPRGRAAEGDVLVVNRDRDAGELVARLVELTGVRARRSSDPAGVVGELGGGGIAAVVVDTRGTGAQDAFEVLEAVRAGAAGVRDTSVILLAESDVDRLPAFRAGADGYVTRPFHADDLIDAVRAALARAPEDRVAYRNGQLMGGAATS